MIDLHLHNLHIHSSLGLVGVHPKNRYNEGLTLVAEQLPDLAAVVNGEHPGLDFNPLELGLTVCGVPFRKQRDMAEILAGVLRAARFASGGTLDEVLQDEQRWNTQVQDVLLDLQERHLRARLARLIGVQPDALQGFTTASPRSTRSGRSAVLQGTLLGADMQFTLEYEHLLLYAGTLPACKVTRLSDLTGATENARGHDVHRDQPQEPQSQEPQSQVSA